LTERFETEWYQQSLTPAPVLEATLKLGIIPTANHVQAWMELKDPSNSILVAAASSPHRQLRDLDVMAKEMLDKLLTQLQIHYGPFDS
jgi:hypothetical protein